MAQKSLQEQKVAALVAQAQKSETFWSAILIFLATLFLLGTFQFYPIILVLVLAAGCAALATKQPAYALLAGLIIALPAVAYQSPVLAWPFLLLSSILMFEAFTDWKILAVLEILILAPFIFSGLPFAGLISILGMGMGAMYFGSKKSLAISLSSVAMILLFSSIWLMENSAYLPLNMDLYEPGKDYLLIGKGPVGFGNLFQEFIGAIGGIFSFQSIGKAWDSVMWTTGNFQILAVYDSLLLQLISWAIVLFLAGYLPGHVRKRPQTTGALALLLLIPLYFLIWTIYGYGIRIEFIAGVILSTAVLVVMEQYKVVISRESEIKRSERMKAYGKFGMSDISLGSAEKSMDDVGGYEDVKKELRNAIMLPLQRKEIAYTYGIKPPSGILLFGPPGTGKTMLMRALSKELKYNFIEVRCSQILSQWYGESEKNVAEVFSNARKASPSVLFFDEIDSVATKRMSDSLDKVGPRVLSTLLQEMDGAGKSKEVVMVVGATNRPDELDPALMRPGRFDKIIYMHLPDIEARKEIFRVSMAGLPVAGDIDLEALAEKTKRFSGADIRNVVVEAKRMAAEKAADTGKIVPIGMEELLEVIGSVKPSTGLAQLDMYERFRLDFERSMGAGKMEKKKKEEAAIGWQDVAGLDQVKDALLESIELPLLHEAEMKEFKVKPSKGILLFGPPGTGKTLIVKAAAAELRASFQTISGAEIMQKGFMQAGGVIKEVFNRARENPPAIIFVDEIETVAPARGLGASAEVVGQFLTEMDGVTGMKGVVVIAATNRPQMMDPAILRPGRFDKIFYIPPPDATVREQIFRIHLDRFAEGVDIEHLASITEGFSGADIAEVCRNVKLKALRSKISGKISKISTEMIEKVIKTRRPSITPALLGEYDRFLHEYGERK